MTPSRSKSTALVILDLGTFDVHLNGGRRMLHMELSIEVDAPDFSDLEHLRQAVMTVAGNHTYDDLNSIDGRLRLRDEIRDALNDLAATSLRRNDVVQRVYFTDFVVL